MSEYQVIPENRACPNCGKSFKCCKDDDCWCENTAMSQGQMLRLLQNHQQCVCSDCLKEYTLK